jgi:hypothetical protein
MSLFWAHRIFKEDRSCKSIGVANISVDDGNIFRTVLESNEVSACCLEIQD